MVPLVLWALSAMAPTLVPLTAIGGGLLGIGKWAVDHESYIAPPRAGCQKHCDTNFGRIDPLWIESAGIWLDDARNGGSEFWLDGEAFRLFQERCNETFRYVHLVDGCVSLPVAWGRGSAGPWSPVRDLSRLLSAESDSHQKHRTLRSLGCTLSAYHVVIVAPRFPSLYATERGVNGLKYIPRYPEIDFPQC